MTNLLTEDIKFYSGDGFSGIGTLGLQNARASEAFGVFGNFISASIGLITVIAIIWFVFIIVSGSLSIISSGGDKNSLESAKKRISAGVIGLVVLIASLFILDIIGKIFGFNALDISGMLFSLTIK